MPYANAAHAHEDRRCRKTGPRRLLKEKLVKWRKDFTIKINMRNLKKTELTRTRPSDAVLEQKAREQDADAAAAATAAADAAIRRAH